MDTTGSLISCTERSERGAEIQNEHPSFASCCCFPEIKPPMDLGSSDQKIIWTFHGNIIGLGEQIGLSPDSSESYGMSSLGGTAQSFCHLLPASTGWLLLLPRWIIRILPYLWIVTIPSIAGSFSHPLQPSTNTRVESWDCLERVTALLASMINICSDACEHMPFHNITLYQQSLSFSKICSKHV